MIELVLFAALSHSIALPPLTPDFTTAPTTMESNYSGEGAVAPHTFVDAAGLNWRGSVEAASAGELERGADFSPFAPSTVDRPLELATNDSPPLGGSYDALMAKRWHWFELYGVSRLHVVPKESRHPWWFSY